MGRKNWSRNECSGSCARAQRIKRKGECSQKKKSQCAGDSQPPTNERCNKNAGRTARHKRKNKKNGNGRPTRGGAACSPHVPPHRASRQSPPRRDRRRTRPMRGRRAWPCWRWRGEPPWGRWATEPLLPPPPPTRSRKTSPFAPQPSATYLRGSE